MRCSSRFSQGAKRAEGVKWDWQSRMTWAEVMVGGLLIAGMGGVSEVVGEV